MRNAALPGIGWRKGTLIQSKNGRIKPDAMLYNGVEYAAPQGTYQIRTYLGPRPSTSWSVTTLVQHWSLSNGCPRLRNDAPTRTRLSLLLAPFHSALDSCSISAEFLEESSFMFPTLNQRVHSRWRHVSLPDCCCGRSYRGVWRAGPRAAAPVAGAYR